MAEMRTKITRSSRLLIFNLWVRANLQTWVWKHTTFRWIYDIERDEVMDDQWWDFFKYISAEMDLVVAAELSRKWHFTPITIFWN